MDEKQILEKQVEALEKLLQLRQAVIEELESKVSKLECEKINATPSYPLPGTYTPWISTPYVQPYNPGFGGSGFGGSGTITISNTCPDGTPHQYPQTYGGTCVPCVKCGQNIGTITSVTGITTQGPLNINGNTTTRANGNITFTNTAGNVPIHTAGYVAPVDMNNNVFTLANVAK